MPLSFHDFAHRVRSADDMRACFRFGLEREALRVDAQGKLQQTPHPAVFGNKRKNDRITVDYAENQLEFVTGVHSSSKDALRELQDTMAWAQQQLPEDEMLWPLSMPPNLHSADEVPIARFDDSPEGQAKEAYRQGLATRYGKIIQIVSGVHYNFSCTDAFWNTVLPNGTEKERTQHKNDVYMGLVRNFLRLRFLLVYAYGASPVAGEGYPHNDDLADYCPVSIRMSRFGYSNAEQRGFVASFNNLDEYIHDLRTACNTPHPLYEQMGLHRDGQLLQLSTNILQTPEEYYSPVRIKAETQSNENVTDALERAGVERLEFRTLDVSPFDASGIHEEQLDVMFILLLHCLFEDSPPLEGDERDCVNTLQRRVALCGRKPGIDIECFGETQRIEDMCHRLMSQLQSIADWLDQIYDTNHYAASLQSYCRSIQSRDILAERMMHQITGKHATHQQFGLHLMREHADQLRRHSVSPPVRNALEYTSRL